MIRICCSKHHVGDRVIGEKEPLEDRNESHGLCDECLVKEIGEINQKIKKIEDIFWRSQRYK